MKEVGRVEVTQEPQKDSSNQQFQLYDSSFKDWISQQAPAILPVLLPGAIYEQTLDVEIARPPMRVDKIFKVLYYGEEHVLHVEFESGYDNQLKSRLLVYNASLYHDHHLPVLTIVMYPFRTTVAKSPLRILSQKKPILTFLFKTLPLFTLDAEEIVRQRHACMYPLIPAMKKANANLMYQVMQELTEIYRDDKETLRQHYICMQVLLSRTRTITRAEKVKIKERLHMFQELFDGSPLIQEIRKVSHDQGREEGIQQGIQNLQVLLIEAVQAKYPDLAEFARQQASHFNKPENLNRILLQIMNAPDANTVHGILEGETGG
jgi:hypothetical protein